MKKYEVTFTKNLDSGTISSTIVFADNEYQVVAHYISKNYFVLACCETSLDPKPGQSVYYLGGK